MKVYYKLILTFFVRFVRPSQRTYNSSVWLSITQQKAVILN